MDNPDRLAAYLADELDPAERAALDDELARDGQLRAELAAMRRADDALDDLDPPAPSDGFDTRMDAFVDDLLAELDAEAPPGVARDTGPRPDHEVPAAAGAHRSGWVLAIAAAIVLLAGVGLATLQPFGGDDTGTGGAELSSLDDQDAGGEIAADDAADMAGPLALPMQPTIVDDDRTLDDDQLDALLAEPVLTEVVAAGLDRDEGTTFGLELQRRLGHTGTSPPADAGVAEETEAAPSVDDRLITRRGDPVEPALLADAERCLGTLLEAGPTVIPVYVELATVGRQQALVFGLVTIDPRDDGFTRREMWTLDRATCEVLRFAQA